MALRMMSVEDKLAVVERVIRNHRDQRSPTVQTLKALAKDLRARVDVPKSNALGQLERALQKMQETRTDTGYDRNMMSEVAKVVINKWSHIRQALEEFGEETAE
jgi:hypothetical protein